jgi:glycosyltransferase involved in cell wall biosynthesis
MTTIQLIIMMKDSEDTILRTLNSYLGQVDRYMLFDTGSSDSTIQIYNQFHFGDSQKLEMIV